MDNFDKRLRDSKDFIEESQIDNPQYIYSFVKKENKKEKGRQLNRGLILRYSFIALVFVFLLINTLGIISKNEGIKNSDGNLNISDVYDDEIRQVKSIDEIRKLLVKGSSSEKGDNDMAEGGVAPDAPGESPSDEDLGSDLSNDREYQTNVQVEDVDEPDVVKVDGDYIYYVTRKKTSSYWENGIKKEYKIGENCLYILKDTNGNLEIVKKYLFENSETLVTSNDEATVYVNKKYTPIDVLYTDKYLIVKVVVSSHNKIVTEKNTYTSNYKSSTEFIIYDLENYEVKKKVSVPGNVVTTRMIDDEMYIISNYYDYNMNDALGVVPIYEINDRPSIVGVDKIYYCPKFGVSANTYIVIFKIVLNDEIEIEDFYLLAPSINEVYVTKESIYLINVYNTKTEKDDKYVTVWPSSKVLVIKLEDKMTYDGVIEVKGEISDQYWIDEYKGFVRVVSAGDKVTYKLVDGIYSYGYEWEKFNYLTIFNKNDEGKWAEISKITEGLGEPGEEVKSARFTGDRLTVVTFKQTDPLYYVDLKDHYKPVITSALKVTGYSVYQHPYKDNYVIGIGYEATESGATTGYKVALFDTSDKENVKQVGNEIVLDYSKYYNLSILSNPRELFLDLEYGIFGFRIASTYDSQTEYFVLFKIDLDSANPISVIEEIERVNSYRLWTRTLDRMVFIKDKYYLLATNKVMAYKLVNGDVEYIEDIPLC